MPARNLATVTVTAALALALPASALATTWTVDPLRPNTGACDPAGGWCKTITQAATAAKDGDTIVIMDGVYAESPLVFGQKNLSIRAHNPGRVRVTSAGGDPGDPVITLGPGGGDAPNGAGDGSSIEGLVVTVPPAGGQAVFVNAKDVSLRSSTFEHPEPSTESAADVPVIETNSDVTTGSTQLVNAFVAQNNGTVGAVHVTNVLNVTNSTIATTKGYAVQYDGGTDPPRENTFLRSRAISTAPAGNAIEVIGGFYDPMGDALPALRLSLDSSIVSGGENGAGILAQSPAFLDANGQDIQVRGIRTTVAGAAKSAVADADPGDNVVTAPGDVFIAFDRSIVHGAAQANDGAALVDGESTASVDIVRSDTDVTPSEGVTAAGNSNTPDAQLFLDPANRNYHLRGDAPVVDRGGTPTADESQHDVDGEPRVAGLASDLGADEIVNHPPVAAFTASATTIRQNQSITFDASASRDPDPGDSVARYRWDFGDGTTALTANPQITHPYNRTGTFDVKLLVVDTHAYASDVKSLTVRVLTAASLAQVRPQISITRPRSGQRVRRSSRFTARGRASDASGIRRVQVSLRLLRRADGRRVRGCQYLRGRSVRRTSCSRPPLLTARFSNGIWAYRARSGTRLPRGTYRLRARATDSTGVRSRTAIRHFRVR